MSKRTTSRYIRSKVPEITPWFWTTKIVMMIVMAATLRWQLKQERYRTWPYWSLVAAVSVFGTSAADGFHVGLGWPNWLSSGFYAVVLACIFVYWYRSEGTLSIYSIINPRRERLYWLTVLATFAPRDPRDPVFAHSKRRVLLANDRVEAVSRGDVGLALAKDQKQRPGRPLGSPLLSRDPSGAVRPTIGRFALVHCHASRRPFVTMWRRWRA